MNPTVPLGEFPESVRNVLFKAWVELRPKSISLFGSRARGDATPVSDFDFAIFGASDDMAWTKFANYVLHDAPTLYGIDLVRYESASLELRQAIDRDGRIVEQSAAA